MLVGTNLSPGLLTPDNRYSEEDFFNCLMWKTAVILIAKEKKALVPSADFNNKRCKGLEMSCVVPISQLMQEICAQTTSFQVQAKGSTASL